MAEFDFIEMKVPAKPEYVGVIRLSISGIANRMGFSFEDIEDLKIAVSEAVTNTVEHAYESASEGEVTIGIGVYDDRIEIMVADHGGSFDLEEVKRDLGPYRPEEGNKEIREGGYGIFIINTLMDKVEINNHYGVIMIMTKYLREAGVAQHGEGIQAK